VIVYLVLRTPFVKFETIKGRQLLSSKLPVRVQVYVPIDCGFFAI